MCLQDEMEKLGLSDHDENPEIWPLHSDFLHTQIQNWKKATCDQIAHLGDSFQLEKICEDTLVADKKQNLFSEFIPSLRSGDWSDIGQRSHMEDTHTCIVDLAKIFGYNTFGEEAISFYGVFDGHGGRTAAQFVRDHLPRAIVEDADFPIELEKVVTRSFVQTDAAFAKSCSVESAMSSGTTALIAWDDD